MRSHIIQVSVYSIQVQLTVVFVRYFRIILFSSIPVHRSKRWSGHVYYVSDNPAIVIRNKIIIAGIVVVSLYIVVKFGDSNNNFVYEKCLILWFLSSVPMILLGRRGTREIGIYI